MSPSLHFPSLLALFSLLLAGCSQPKAPTDPESGEATPPPSREESTETEVENLDATAAAQRLASDDEIVILDVRTPAEYQEGRIEGARLVDFKAPDFKEKLGELDRDTTYLVHCRSGNRSTQSLPTFRELGFRHIIHLDGGISAWSEGGHPVEK